MPLTDFVNLCPADCNTALLYPAIDADPSCTNFDTFESQVSDVWIMPTGAANPFTWAVGETITGVAPNVDNTDTLNAFSKWMKGEGGVAVPDKTVVQLHDFIDKTSKRRYTLNFVIKNVSYQMYEFLRAIQCGGTSFTFWYATYGKHLFGKDGGIVPVLADVDLPLDASRDGIEQATLILQWEANVDPERKVNPFA